MRAALLMNKSDFLLFCYMLNTSISTQDRYPATEEEPARSRTRKVVQQKPQGRKV
jgi:hypothetical protein